MRRKWLIYVVFAFYIKSACRAILIARFCVSLVCFFSLSVKASLMLLLCAITGRGRHFSSPFLLAQTSTSPFRSDATLPSLGTTAALGRRQLQSVVGLLWRGIHVDLERTFLARRVRRVVANVFLGQLFALLGRQLR